MYTVFIYRVHIQGLYSLCKKSSLTFLIISTFSWLIQWIYVYIICSLWLIAWLIDCLIVWLPWLIDSLIALLFDCLIDWLPWLTDWLIAWLIDFLINWLIEGSFLNYFTYWECPSFKKFTAYKFPLYFCYFVCFYLHIVICYCDLGRNYF